MANIQNVSLERTLSPTQVWALALGSIVGWGCFVLPGDKFLPEAGPLAALIGFAIGTLLLCFVAVSYSYDPIRPSGRRRIRLCLYRLRVGQRIHLRLGIGAWLYFDYCHQHFRLSPSLPLPPSGSL